MGLKRATRPGQEFVVALLCDPSYQAARAARIGAAAQRVWTAEADAGGDGGALTTRRAGAAADEERRAVEAEESAYRLALDAALLKTPLDGVTRATIRALTGDDAAPIRDAARSSALAEVRAARKRGTVVDEDDPDNIVRWRRESEVRLTQSGLVSFDFDGPGIRPEGDVYPLASLVDIGLIWLAVCEELAGYIQTAGDLGE